MKIENGSVVKLTKSVEFHLEGQDDYITTFDIGDEAVIRGFPDGGYLLGVTGTEWIAIVSENAFWPTGERRLTMNDNVLNSDVTYEVAPEVEETVWIDIDGVSVSILRTARGLLIEAYPRGDEALDPDGQIKLFYEELKYSDYALELLWEELGYVGIDDDGITDMPFIHFPEGTDREVIWKWFDRQHSKGVAWLLNDYDKSN